MVLGDQIFLWIGLVELHKKDPSRSSDAGMTWQTSGSRSIWQQDGICFMGLKSEVGFFGICSCTLSFSYGFCRIDCQRNFISFFNNFAAN